MTPFKDVLLRFSSYAERVERLRVLLAESHPLFRQAIVEVLARIRRVRLIAKVGSGWDVMRISAQLKPDVILTDFSLPGLSGLEVTSLIKRELPQIPVVILLDEEDEKYITAVEQSGAWAHVAKSQLAQELPSLLGKLERNEKGKMVQARRLAWGADRPGQNLRLQSDVDRRKEVKDA